MLPTIVSLILIFFYCWMFLREAANMLISFLWFHSIDLERILANSDAVGSKDALEDKVHRFIIGLVNWGRKISTKYFQNTLLPSSHMTPSCFFLLSSKTFKILESRSFLLDKMFFWTSVELFWRVAWLLTMQGTHEAAVSTWHFYSNIGHFINLHFPAFMKQI